MVNHTFLVKAGRWTLQGHWLERDGRSMKVMGKTLIAWSSDRWFTIATKLTFPQEGAEDISYQSRGRFDNSEQRYTFVLQHSALGRVEGEGWITPESLVQRYWVLGDAQKRSGFETLYRLNDDRYCFASGLMAGHSLTGTMEAALTRQSP